MAYITVDLDQFDDDDIREEYHARGLGDDDPQASTGTLDEHEVLTKIWLHDREGRKDRAYTLMREYVLNKLNKVV
jgi:hypothetical protein